MNETDTGWQGETFFGRGDTRIDFQLFSQYVLVDDCLVDIARGKRFKIGDPLSPLEHVPVVTNIRYSFRMQSSATTYNKMATL